MKRLLIAALFLAPVTAFRAGAQSTHEMQHGFILSTDDTFASHLVADGHHSWQAEVIGHFTIEDEAERTNYEKLKSANTKGENYFLLLAQKVDLPSLKVGQELSGPLVELPVNTFDTSPVIAKRATFTIEKILVNVPNPFFGDQ